MTSTPRTGLIVAIAAAVLIVAVSVTVAVLVPDRGSVAGIAVAGPAAEPTAGPTTSASGAGSTTSCVYNRASDGPVGKDVGLPDNAGQAPDTGTVQFTLRTDQGDIPITLDRAKAPCAVHSLLFLAGKKYFDGTPCHRLTIVAGLKVLQCGDPSGSGYGGPGYQFDDELPSDLKPAGQGTVIYPTGTVAMANAGPGTNGSQFFLVYGDSQLPPSYPVLGSYTTAALTVIDKVVAGGVTAGEYREGDGKPKIPVTIQQAIVG
ncbi:peptidylprolyl isomerase [Kibdelosporangium persicum]|uniref:Peptidyl-prolyl cis-trans isomerase n=1 Tax=Kibdelosporangium persicum TaxID=2698649 RepID=A0ABX2F197_9PSEU|nr:peptidylprolyl isomerase [Kibdelosporangium persicum]NRN65104.1 Peptidyl-prolyl cis-trans isomerase [Kibdelosporangium persicum]